MENIVIVGSSGHAKVVIDIVERECKYKIVGLLDPFRAVNEATLGYRVLGGEADLDRLIESHGLEGAIVAIGDNFLRSLVVDRIRNVAPGLRFVSAIHPSASLARNVSIGEGTVIMAGVSVNPCCSVGRFCILNTQCSLDHDSTTGDFSSLGPGARIGGHCSIGTYSAFGIGAVMSHRLQIGEHAVIGAGSVVVKSIRSFVTAYGVPAKEVGVRQRGDAYLR